MVKTGRRLLFLYYVIALHVLLLYFIVDNVARRYIGERHGTASFTEPQAPLSAASPTPLVRPPASPSSESGPTIDQGSIAATPTGLIIPVEGMRPGQLVDSFADLRSEGRVHGAIDIAAPAGTPVLAAADGKILKFLDSKPGGITIYQLSVDEKYVYYYAHLERRAEDLNEGDLVRQGRVIGFVGDTGNAGAGNYHLHFSIAAIGDPKRYWEGGANINPYPLLKH